MERMSEHTGLISSYQLLITAACTNTGGKMKGSHSRAADRCPFVLRHSLSQVSSFMQSGMLWWLPYKSPPTGLCHNGPPLSQNGRVSAGPWWHHQMEIFSVLLALCAGNSPITGGFLSQRPVTSSCDVSFDLAWRNSWVNNWDAGDLRRQHAHYDVTVMPSLACCRCPLCQMSKNGKGFILQQRMCMCDILKWLTMLPRWPAPHPGRVLLHTASWISLCLIKGLALAVWM